MELREVAWTDAYGRKWATLIPQDEPDEAARTGLPLGPPSLEALGLPLEYEVRLHNELFKRRIFTFPDVAARGGIQRLEEVVRSLVRLGAHELFEHYRNEAGGKS